MEKINIEIIDRSMQARCGHSEAVVEEYAEAMLDGKKFPPIEIAFADARYYVTDGIHRVMAAEKIGKKTIPATVTKCSLAAAWRAALGSNANHGLRRSNDDKQNAMLLAWEKRQLIFGGNPSARALADVCAVTAPTASAFIDKQHKAAGEGCKDFTPPQQVVGRDGKLYPQRPVRPVRAPLPTTQQPTASVPAAADADGDQPAATKKAPQRPVYRDKNAGEHCVPTDCFGVEIPVPLQPAFDGVDISRDIAKGLRDGLHKFKEAVQQQAPFVAIYKQPQAVQMDIEKALGWFIKRNAEPFCVCPPCRGQGCKVCRNIGWLTRFGYDKALPSDLKAAYNLPMTAAEAAATDDESEVQA